MRPHTYRFLDKVLPTDNARRAHELLADLRRGDPAEPTPYGPRRKKPSLSAATSRPDPLPIFAPTPPIEHGDRAPQPSRFSPANARKAFAEPARHLQLRIHIQARLTHDDHPPHPLLRPPGKASMPQVQSWKTRLARYDLPPDVVVTLYVTTHQDQATWTFPFSGPAEGRMAS